MLRIPELPENIKAPCEPLSNITGLSAQENYQWALDTVDKYNRCVIVKDAVTSAYLSIQKEINDVKP